MVGGGVNSFIATYVLVSQRRLSHVAFQIHVVNCFYYFYHIAGNLTDMKFGDTLFLKFGDSVPQSTSWGCEV